MNLSDLNDLNLDPNNIGSWPVAARAIVLVLLCIAILFGGYYLDTSDQLLEIETAQDKEISLKSEFEKKQAKATNLEAYKEQMEEMQRSFGALLQQLPGKTEVAELLVDISRIGIISGLEFEYFKPEAERPKEFYAELPIKIRVRGSYHQFGNFASATAALSRIVTLHDLVLSSKSKKSDDGRMTMEATAKTYRYLDKEETSAKKKRKRRGKK
ncbi:MAG: type 4a pilus biogenesis protein PilO [Ectothiorhodospiraceae bacterium]|nr:type 4a pilus biogenesis protein PilO [Ectothiorhodospiraceae bacterium]